MSLRARYPASGKAIKFICFTHFNGYADSSPGPVLEITIAKAVLTPTFGPGFLNLSLNGSCGAGCSPPPALPPPALPPPRLVV